MRFKSKVVDGVQAFAVSGTNTISFGIKASPSARNGLMGFAIDRYNPTAAKPSDRHWEIKNFKVFKSLIKDPKESTWLSTWKHPVQSFVWDDFNGVPNHGYEYRFTPLKGQPGKLEANAAPVSIKVRTEPLFSDETHDVFFNRGVASSQAYGRKFQNKKPDQLSPAKKQEALDWLSRDLDEAILKFIAAARKGDTLLCCFYEFRYPPVAEALEASRHRGVKVRIIIDAKRNGRVVKGVQQPDAPREDNLKTIKDAGLPNSAIILRDANPADIQHNKFMVLLKGAKARPTEVWTGSTNLSTGGIHGQTNVGHWIRDPKLAKRFADYWTLVATNPGSVKGKTAAANKTKKASYRSAVEKLNAIPGSVETIAKGVTPVFSPRKGLAILDLYVKLVDKATNFAAITLAFGISKQFKDQLGDNTVKSPLLFMLLEKADRQSKSKKVAFVNINAKNNIYKAWGSFLNEPLYQWAKETNAKLLALNKWVNYIHSKFLLHDPLGNDPIVVTGSANFSKPSTDANDENMVIIRGDRRVADIYFTEFNRLFFHYYFRSVREARKGKKTKTDIASLFLDETGKEWMKSYAPGKLRTKRVDTFANMQGATTA